MKNVKYRLFQTDHYRNRRHLCQLSNAKQAQSPQLCETTVQAIFYLYSSYLAMEPLDPFEMGVSRALASGFHQQSLQIPRCPDPHRRLPYPERQQCLLSPKYRRQDCKHLGCRPLQHPSDRISHGSICLALLHSICGSSYLLFLFTMEESKCFVTC